MEKNEVKDKQTWKWAREAGYESLAEEIVKTAIQDYKDAKRKNDHSKIIALQRFFKSEWCELLCSVDGDLLIETCENKCERLKEIREKKKNGQRKTSKPLPRQD